MVFFIFFGLFVIVIIVGGRTLLLATMATPALQLRRAEPVFYLFGIFLPLDEALMDGQAHILFAGRAFTVATTMFVLFFYRLQTFVQIMGSL